MARRNRPINLPAPYLRRFGSIRRGSRTATPIRFACRSLPMFEFAFDRPITIIVGENGTGKSTLLEGIAGSRAMTRPAAARATGRSIIPARSRRWAGGSRGAAGGWLPKITNGWFFRAESFFSVARYLDEAARDVRRWPADFLSHSHGEGFLRFFEERCERQGLFIFDEPESALSPARQIEFLKLLRRMDSRPLPGDHGDACAAADGLPGAPLLRLTKYGLEPVKVEDTEHSG